MWAGHCHSRTSACVLLAQFTAEQGTFSTQQAPVQAKRSGSPAGWEFY
jgi:hypothetical protein